MLPQIVLDDVRFQELVSEARTRIVRHAPEWTEHNVSDPGITLIELFAWLTEILSYRIDRIPERLHLALLGLVGVVPGEPQRASAELRFMLAGDVLEALVPAGTELASPRAAGGELIVFATNEDLAIPARSLVACRLEREGTSIDVPVDGGTARAGEHPLAIFGDPPSPGGALMLGFEQPIARLVIRVELDCLLAEARNLDLAAPPLAWEASAPGAAWLPAVLIGDETAAFLDGSGVVTLEVPAGAHAAEAGGRELHWLRCRLLEDGRGERQPRYDRAPRLSSVSAATAGAIAGATHACAVTGELVGVSDGVPGSAYQLQQRPVLPLAREEILEVREQGSGGWAPWRRVDSFALSGPYDRHFVLDETAGEIRFGPAVRQPDGGWRRYGAVPPAGAALRLTRYRYGGGSAGNVAPRTLRIMPAPVPGIAAATNPRAATGGVDGESLGSVSERARIDIRERTRAVTAGDFEELTLAASADVARALCAAPPGGGAIRVSVLRRVAPADRRLELDELIPSAALMQTLAAALDERRLLGTSIHLAPVALRPVSVVVDLRASPRADLERVQADVEHALYVFLNPLIGGRRRGRAVAGRAAGRSIRASCSGSCTESRASSS